MSTCRSLAAAMAGLVLAAAPALADPTVGLGLSMSFGQGQTETGVGLRVFSDDEADSVVGSVGLDYMFQSKSLRGTLGAAYLGTDAYVGFDLGVRLQGGAMDFGVGLGVVNTEDAAVVCPIGMYPVPGGGCS